MRCHQLARLKDGHHSHQGVRGHVEAFVVSVLRTLTWAQLEEDAMCPATPTSPPALHTPLEPHGGDSRELVQQGS